MADDRIGTKDNPPKKTVCGHALEAQHRFTIGIGGGRYVIVGHSDSNYQEEIEKLKRVKPIVRMHKKGAIDEQQENEGDSK
ncbi:hypothetical protein LCGC14_1043310 [marine sediment metagenome]|uniref:Uncharacterized protein n=1 Tax=marine sediment metagenome TaxID=412755 RepID=A0A0F9NCV0_9ZZZZ